MLDLRMGVSEFQLDCNSCRSGRLHTVCRQIGAQPRMEARSEKTRPAIQTTRTLPLPGSRRGVGPNSRRTSSRG